MPNTASGCTLAVGRGRAERLGRGRAGAVVVLWVDPWLLRTRVFPPPIPEDPEGPEDEDDDLFDDDLCDFDRVVPFLARPLSRLAPISSFWLSNDPLNTD